MNVTRKNLITATGNMRKRSFFGVRIHGGLIGIHRFALSLPMRQRFSTGMGRRISHTAVSRTAIGVNKGTVFGLPNWSGGNGRRQRQLVKHD